MTDGTSLQGEVGDLDAAEATAPPAPRCWRRTRANVARKRGGYGGERDLGVRQGGWWLWRDPCETVKMGDNGACVGEVGSKSGAVVDTEGSFRRASTRRWSSTGNVRPGYAWAARDDLPTGDHAQISEDTRRRLAGRNFLEHGTWGPGGSSDGGDTANARPFV